MLGVEIREVVGDFELADAGGEAVGKITCAYDVGIECAGLLLSGNEIAVEHVDELAHAAQACKEQARCDVLDDPG